MSAERQDSRLEGIVHAARYSSTGEGKQFLGAAIECDDGSVWVIDYSEQSPFHAFAGRHVVASGEPYEPEGQYLVPVRGKALGHFRVSSLRLTEVLPDSPFVEVGAGRRLRGRFERVTGDAGDSVLSFVPEEGDAFVVANDPAGATVGPTVEVWAYAVQRPSSTSGAQLQSLWVICPCSAADIWKWREAHSQRSRRE